MEIRGGGGGGNRHRVIWPTDLVAGIDTKSIVNIFICYQRAIGCEQRPAQAAREGHRRACVATRSLCGNVQSSHCNGEDRHRNRNT